MTKLNEKAMLAELNISQWSARRVDKKATDKVQQDFAAKAGSGRYNKALVSRVALAEVQKKASEAREVYYRLTAPWADNGQRILTTQGYLQFTKEITAVKAEFDKAVKRFLANYPEYVDDAKAELGRLFNENEYPTTAEIANKFRFAVNVVPMPDADDFRVDLPSEEVDKIKAEIEQRSKALIDNAVKDAYGRIADVVGKVADKLTEYDPSNKKAACFRDSLVTNVVELVDVLPLINVTGDQKLTELTTTLRSKLTTYTAEELRVSTRARTQTITAAKAILDQVSDYLA